MIADRVIAAALSAAMAGIAIGYMAIDGFDPFWIFYLALGLTLPLLLAISHPATLAAFALLSFPGGIAAYVVCDIMPGNAALDVHHALLESPLVLLMMVYGSARCIWEVVVKLEEKGSARP